MACEEHETAVVISNVATRGADSTNTSNPVAASSDTLTGNEDTQSRAAKGRIRSIQNYNKEDILLLFKLAEEILPVTDNGWEGVSRAYNEDRRKIGRALRTSQSLRTELRKLATGSRLLLLLALDTRRQAHWHRR